MPSPEEIRITGDPLRPTIVLMAITILFAGLLMLRDLLVDPPADMGPPGIIILALISFSQEYKNGKRDRNNRNNDF